MRDDVLDRVKRTLAIASTGEATESVCGDLGEPAARRTSNQSGCELLILQLTYQFAFQ